RIDAFGLGHDGRNTREVADPHACYAKREDMKRQLRERAGVADDLKISPRDREGALVVPHGATGGRGRPSPSPDVFRRDARELRGCALQDGGRGDVSFGRQQNQAVKQEAERPRSPRRPRQGLDSATDLTHAVPLREMLERRVPGDQVGLARELYVERLEPPRGLQQERTSIAAEG